MDIDGFSRSNLNAKQKFYLSYNEIFTTIQQPTGQLEINKFKHKFVMFNQIVHQVRSKLQDTDNLLIKAKTKDLNMKNLKKGFEKKFGKKE